MADTPTIWWYPEPDRAPITISIPRKAQGATWRQVWNGSVSQTIGGRVHTQTFGAIEQVDIEWFGFGPSPAAETFHRDIVALEGHLRRGGYVFVALNTDRAWAAFGSNAARGDAAILVEPSIINGLQGAPTLTDANIFALGPQPEQWRELHSSSGLVGNSLNLSTSLQYPWEEQPWIFLREEQTFPYARLRTADRNSEIISMEAQRRFTVRLPLEIDPDMISIISGSDLELGDADGFLGPDYIRNQLQEAANLTVGSILENSPFGNGWSF